MLIDGGVSFYYVASRIEQKLDPRMRSPSLAYLSWRSKKGK
jgi:hypothetical protein